MAIDTRNELHPTNARHFRHATPHSDAQDTRLTLWSVLVILALAVLGYIAYAVYFNTDYDIPTQTMARDVNATTVNPNADQ